MTVQGGRSSSWRRPSWTGQGLGGHAFAKATLERLPRCSRQGRFRFGASHRSQIDQGLPGRCNPDRHAAQPRLAGAVGPRVLELQVNLGQRLLHGVDGAAQRCTPSPASTDNTYAEQACNRFAASRSYRSLGIGRYGGDERSDQLATLDRRVFHAGGL